MRYTMLLKYLHRLFQSLALFGTIMSAVVGVVAAAATTGVVIVSGDGGFECWCFLHMISQIRILKHVQFVFFFFFVMCTVDAHQSARTPHSTSAKIEYKIYIPLT